MSSISRLLLRRRTERQHSTESEERLASGAKDADWTLVATSCVEAGVDVSFRTGLRELASLTSLIQVGGRVNRSGEYGSADVWGFQCVKWGWSAKTQAIASQHRYWRP